MFTYQIPVYESTASSYSFTYTASSSSSLLLQCDSISTYSSVIASSVSLSFIKTTTVSNSYTYSESSYQTENSTFTFLERRASLSAEGKSLSSRKLPFTISNLAATQSSSYTFYSYSQQVAAYSPIEVNSSYEVSIWWTTYRTQRTEYSRIAWTASGVVTSGTSSTTSYTQIISNSQVGSYKYWTPRGVRSTSAESNKNYYKTYNNNLVQKTRVGIGGGLTYTSYYTITETTTGAIISIASITTAQSTYAPMYKSEETALGVYFEDTDRPCELIANHNSDYSEISAISVDVPLGVYIPDGGAIQALSVQYWTTSNNITSDNYQSTTMSMTGMPGPGGAFPHIFIYAGTAGSGESSYETPDGITLNQQTVSLDGEGLAYDADSTGYVSPLETITTTTVFTYGTLPFPASSTNINTSTTLKTEFVVVGDALYTWSAASSYDVIPVPITHNSDGALTATVFALENIYTTSTNLWSQISDNPYTSTVTYSLYDSSLRKTWEIRTKLAQSFYATETNFLYDTRTRFALGLSDYHSEYTYNILYTVLPGYAGPGGGFYTVLTSRVAYQNGGNTIDRSGGATYGITSWVGTTTRQEWSHGPIPMRVERLIPIQRAGIQPPWAMASSDNVYKKVGLTCNLNVPVYNGATDNIIFAYNIPQTSIAFPFWSLRVAETGAYQYTSLNSDNNPMLGTSTCHPITVLLSYSSAISFTRSHTEYSLTYTHLLPPFTRTTSVTETSSYSMNMNTIHITRQIPILYSFTNLTTLALNTNIETTVSYQMEDQITDGTAYYMGQRFTASTQRVRADKFDEFGTLIFDKPETFASYVAGGASPQGGLSEDGYVPYTMTYRSYYSFAPNIPQDNIVSTTQKDVQLAKFIANASASLTTTLGKFGAPVLARLERAVMFPASDGSSNYVCFWRYHETTETSIATTFTLPTFW